MKAARLNEQTSPVGTVASAWSARVDGEPSVDEILADPIIRSVMRRDGVTLDALNVIIGAARASVRFGQARRAA